MSKRPVSPTCNADVSEAKKMMVIKNEYGPDDQLFLPVNDVEIVLNCHFQVKAPDPSNANSYNFKIAGGGKETIRMKVPCNELTIRLTTTMRLV